MTTSTDAATTLTGPLTAFNPPSSCFNQLWLNANSDLLLGNPYDNADCKPTAWNTPVQYSPALCPTSYYNARGSVTTRSTITETVMECCPDSFRADPGTYSCVSQIDTSLASIAYTYSSDGSQYTTITPVTGQGVNAHSIQVRYQSSDSALLFAASTTTSSSTPSENTSATSTASNSSSTSTPLATASPTPAPSPNTGLSTGAKAGIAVGVILAAILAAVLIWLAVRARKRKSNSAKQQSTLPYEMNDKRYQSGQKYGHHPLPPEMAAPTSEMPAGSGNNRARVELPE